MNILITTLDGGGNLPPVLGLANRLKKRGHKVTVLTEPCLENTVTVMGLDYIPFREHYTRTDRNEDLMKDAGTNIFNNPFLDEVVFGPAGVQVSETLGAVRSTQADVVLADCLLPSSAMAAEVAGIPSVVLFHMPEYFPGPNRPPGIMGLTPGKGLTGRLRDKLLGMVFNAKLNGYLKKINEVRAEYRLNPLKNTRELVDRADIRLIQTLKSFDFPIEPAPANVRYTAPVLDDPDWTAQYHYKPEADSRPLVIVSLSSTFQDQASVVQRCMDALGNMEVRGLVTLGPAIKDVIFRVPDNVKVITGAPHAAIFPHAAAVITHAGHGTLMKALSFGLPVLCLPMGRVQNDNAAKVRYHGAGLQLRHDSKPDAIARALNRLLQEERFSKTATALAQQIRDAAAQDNSVEIIEQLNR